MATGLSDSEPARSGSDASKETCPICGGLGYLRRDVSVDDPEFGRLVPCSCQEAALAERRLSRLRALSQLSGLERMTFQSFRTDVRGMVPEQLANLRWAVEEARSFADRPEGWLVLRGGFGCGKTHLAAAIANACIERGQPVLFQTVPDLLDYLRSTYAPTSGTSYDDTFEQIRNAPVLILDDLGTESSTPWAQEKLFQILNHRYSARLPTMITTNRELDEIPLRLRSRLADLDLTRIVSIIAPDYRQTGVAQDQSDLSSLSLHGRQTFGSFDTRKRVLPVAEHETLRAALREARRYAQAPNGWLVLNGTFGCGKTHLAAAIANYQMAEGHPALFVVVPDLLDHLRATFSPRSGVSFDKRFEEVRRTPFLVLDDLGTESATPWAREKLYQIFDYRYNAQLPTVITSATPIKELDARLRTRMEDERHCLILRILAPAYSQSNDAPGSPNRRRAR